MTFTEYCAKEGVFLLKDDLGFIRNQLKHLSKTRRKAVMLRYVDIWVDTMALCDDALKAQNEGRRAANLWLLVGDYENTGIE